MAKGLVEYPYKMLTGNRIKDGGHLINMFDFYTFLTDKDNLHSLSGIDGSANNEVKLIIQSPEVSPVLPGRTVLPDRSVQERVVVRLPSMWQDYDAG